MSDETLLTDLCSICHLNTIKYTCPRCGTHTCSLPCVKKHKTWAQCSGVRNPAEYRKRSELATSSSIDKDFNFITNVERAITRADQRVLDKGINLAPARQVRGIDKRPKVDLEIEERGISVVKAPKGLSRSQQNKTHWNSAQNCILWTIEWISYDGAKNVGHALESKTLAEAYIATVGKKKIKRKRRLSQHESSMTSKAPRQDGEIHVNYDQEKQENAAEPEMGKLGSADDELLEGLHFYLHKPLTSSTYKCLIPLEKSQTVGTALQRQTLLEYPTFYVKTESVGALQEPFISSAEYAKRHGSDIPINVSAPLEDGEVDEAAGTRQSSSVDAQTVLQVLAQDLTG